MHMLFEMMLFTQKIVGRLEVVLVEFRSVEEVLGEAV